MPDEPAGAALLDAARRALMDEVVPGLAGRPRYVALMVANAIGIASREITEATALSAAEGALPAGPGASAATLARDIRDGAFDADRDLHAALTGTTEVAARVWKPVRTGA